MSQCDIHPVMANLLLFKIGSDGRPIDVLSFEDQCDVEVHHSELGSLRQNMSKNRRVLVNLGI